MSQATNTKLMDTEPGGEQTQYEGAKVFKDQVSPPNQSDKDASTQSSTSVLVLISTLHHSHYTHLLHILLPLRSLITTSSRRDYGKDRSRAEEGTGA